MNTDLQTHIKLGKITDTKTHGIYVIGSGETLIDGTRAYRLFHDGQVLFGGKPFTETTANYILKTMGA